MSDKVKNRKWVTRLIIGFVAGLLLLTFFSNTIMNLFIPKVAGKRASRANLSLTNSASAVVEPETSYKVMSIEGRKIDHVAVSDYDEVKKGDVLFTLYPVTDTSALDSLRHQLTEVKREDEYASRTPSDTDYATLRASVSQAQESLKDARESLNTARNKNDTVSRANKIIDKNNPKVIELTAEVTSASDTVEDLNKKVDTVNSEIETKNKELKDLEEKSAEFVPSSPEDVNPYEEQIATVKEELGQKEQEVKELKSQLGSAQDRLEKLSSELSDCNAAIQEAEAAIAAAESVPSVSSAKVTVESAEAALASARRTLDNTRINEGIARDRARDAAADRKAQISKLETQIKELEDNYAKTDITAPADGRIYALSVGDGDTMEENSVVLFVVPVDTKYTATFCFPTELVERRMTPGMQLSSDTYWLQSCEILSIKPDPEAPRENRLVKCSLAAEYILPGESVTVSPGRSDSDYDCCIASSAVNEDNAGTFVYLIDEVRSPLGNRYTVRRVDVEVLATDGAVSALSGSGLDQGMIVIRSEKALEDGQRVRLEDYTGK